MAPEQQETAEYDVELELALAELMPVFMKAAADPKFGAALAKNQPFVTALLANPQFCKGIGDTATAAATKSITVGTFGQ